MPLDNWDDERFFKDEINIILSRPRSQKKKPVKTKRAAVAANDTVDLKETGLENDDDFWFAQPEEPIETPVATRCSQPVKVERLFELPPEKLSTNPDIAHLAKCPFCSARYQAEKQRRETS